MGWPKGKRRVEQGNSVFEPTEEVSTPLIDAPSDFDGFSDWAQRRRIADGVVLVSLSHPDAPKQGHFDGLFSGFSLSVGNPHAKWADGSEYPS